MDVQYIQHSNGTAVVEAKNMVGEYEPIVKVIFPWSDECEDHIQTTFVQVKVFSFFQDNDFEDNFYFDCNTLAEDTTQRKVQTCNTILLECYEAAACVFADLYFFLDFLIPEGFMQMPLYNIDPDNKFETIYL